MRTGWTLAGAAMLALLWSGCEHTSPELAMEVLEQSNSTAWSLRASSNEPMVYVSPAQKTLRLAGSAGNVLGTGISAVANDKYRLQLLDALAGYDAGGYFEQYLRTQLETHLGPNGVAPLGSTAGYHTRRDAEKERYARLASLGHDAVLELKIMHGLFSPSAELAVGLEANLLLLPQGHRRYAHNLVVAPGPVLADAPRKDPVGGLLPDASENLLAVEEGAVARWLEDGATPYKQAFEQAVRDATAAVLCDLGFIRDARGFYQLGRQALRDKKAELALAHFDAALTIDPAYIEAASARAVALAQSGAVREAVTAAEAVLETNPDYAPAHFNLAWWQAVELGQPDQARPHYEYALAHGTAPARKIEKVLN